MSERGNELIHRIQTVCLLCLNDVRVRKVATECLPRGPAAKDTTALFFFFFSPFILRLQDTLTHTHTIICSLIMLSFLLIKSNDVNAFIWGWIFICRILLFTGGIFFFYWWGLIDIFYYIKKLKGRILDISNIFLFVIWNE